MIATLTFAAVVLAFGYGVFARYVLHNPSDIASEVAIILYLWTIMIGGSLAVGLKDHISFDLLVDRLSRTGRRLVEGLGMGIAGVVLLYALPTTIDYVLFLWRERTPALEFSLDKVYFCFIIFQAATALMLLSRAAELALGRTDAGDSTASADAERGLS